MDFSKGSWMNIFVRLPVTDLLRCKLVCKSWLSLISSPIFIQEHLQVLQKHLQVCDTNLLVTAINRNDRLHTVLDTAFIVSSETLRPLAFKIGRRRHFDGNWYPKLVGSCNGLVCGYVYGCDKGDYGGFLWNPATNETVDLPPHSIQGTGLAVVGFGFDANNNDYKVLFVHSGELEDDLHRLEVYSLRKDSWKQVAGIQGMDLWFEADTVGAYNDGMFSWIGYDWEGEVMGDYTWMDEIVSFDFSTEVTVRTPLPGEIGTHGAFDVVNRVGVLNGSLTVLNVDINLIEFDIWVLHEIGVAETWVKLYTIEIGVAESWYTLCWKNGLVFWIENDGLFWFDPASQQKIRIGIPKLRYEQMNVISYWASLVQINHIRGTEV